MSNIQNNDGSRHLPCAVCLEREDGFRIELKEFVDYNKAVELFHSIRTRTDLIPEDEVDQLIAENIKSIQTKRKRRRKLLKRRRS